MNLPFGNAPKVVAVLVVFIALWLIAPIKSCHAAELELTGGVAVIRGNTSSLGAKLIVPNVVGDYGDLACGILLIGASTWNGNNQTQAIVHCQLQTRISRFVFGIGPAKLQHADAYNSGGVNFSLSAQVRAYRDLYLGWQHFSNAGSLYPNYGRDVVTASWRFK